jgi:hypothetical protein
MKGVSGKVTSLCGSQRALTHFVNAELVVVGPHRVVDVALRWRRVGHGDRNFKEDFS